MARPERADDTRPDPRTRTTPSRRGSRPAFEPDSTAAVSREEGVLAALQRRAGSARDVLLRDEPDEAPAGRQPPVAGGGRRRRRAGPLPVPGEIARGGMGVVLKGPRPRPRPRRRDEGAPGGACRDDPGWSAGSSRRPRSAASSSTPASSRSTSWGSIADAPALLHDEAGPGPDARGPARRARPDPRQDLARASSRSSSRSARRSPTPTPGA